MLKLQWKAILKDGTLIEQYDKDKEQLFKKVQENFDTLTTFVLTHTEKPLTIIIDLVSGLIFIKNNSEFANWWGSDLTSKKKNIRLIYFRRNRVTTTGKQDIRYYTGYQYNDNLGRNKKVILQINNNGNIIIGD